MRRAGVLLLNPPREIQRMRVGHFVRAIPYVGRHRAAALLEAVGIADERRQVGPSHRSKRPITDQQRRDLAAALLRAAPRPASERSPR
jgi:hypothetical protein